MKRVVVVAALCCSLVGFLFGALLFRTLRAQESAQRVQAQANAAELGATRRPRDEPARDDRSQDEFDGDKFDGANPLGQPPRAPGRTRDDRSRAGDSADAFDRNGRARSRRTRDAADRARDAGDRPGADFTRDLGGRAATSESPRLREARRGYEQAEAHVQELARSLQDPRRPAQDDDADSLRRAVAQAFEARQKLMELEIADFQARLDALSKRFAERNKAANEVIDRRVQELLRPNLRWDDEADAPADNRRQPGGARADESRASSSTQADVFDSAPRD